MEQIKGMFDNVAKSYRKDYLIGFIKGAIEQAMYVHHADYYRKELLKMHMAIQELSEIEEKERDYNGIL